MAWREQLGTITLDDGRVLVAGSFRGVGFRTVNSEIKVGRRNVINEFPQRDLPYVDDLGRRARRYVVEAYVIGDNYLDDRDDLIDALEEKGPGELIHPRYGVLKVALDGEVPIKETPEAGGIARLTITFVEDTSDLLPKGSENTVANLETATNAADEATESCFASEFTVEGPSVLSLQAIKGFTANIAGVLGMARQVTSVGGLAEIVRQVGGMTGKLAALIRTPVVLVQSLRSVFAQLVQELRQPLAAFDEFQSVFFANRRSPAGAFTGSTRARSLVNATATADLQRRLALTNQARILAVAISNTDVVATKEKAIELRTALLAQIDEELEVNDPPVEVARTLTTVRAAVVRDVAARSEFLQKTSTFTPLAVLPAVVVAHRVYQDASRADELVDRNAIAHPAFVPARALEVLQ